MSNPDSSQRFLFDSQNIRGELVGLETTLKDVLTKHNYPEKIKVLLGEFMAASALLASSIKFNGSLIIQLSAKGQLRTLMAECNHQTGLRAIARYNDDFNNSEPLIENAQVAISIIPTEGSKYQGIVNFDQETGVAGAIEQYFTQSEQIKTRIWLKCDGTKASGYMLQAMPESSESSSLQISDEDWNRIEHLSSTIKDDELLHLDNETLLYRLFHEEQVRLFEEKALNFQCTCSEERSIAAILQIGIDEARSVIDEMSVISADCQFCHSHYQFDSDQIEKLFADHLKQIN